MKGIFKASWRVALALALVLSLGLVTAAPAAGIGNASVSVIPNTAGAPAANYTIIVATAQPLLASEQIIIDFPGGTPPAGTGLSVATVSIDDGAILTPVADAANARLLITLSAACPAGQHKIEVFNVTNPCPAKDYTLKVSTTEEPSAVESTSYTIIAGTPNHVVISPRDYTACANETVTYTAESQDACNNTVAAASCNWSVDGTLKATGTSSFVYYDCTPGTYNISANCSAGVDSTTLTITTAAPCPVANLAVLNQPTATQAGVAITPAVCVNVTDVCGTPLSGRTITVEVASGGPGTFMSGSTTTNTTDTNGIVCFTNLKLCTPGTYNLTFTGSVTKNSDAFNVTPGIPVKLCIYPNPASTTCCQNVTFTAMANDVCGNNVSPAGGTVTYSIVGGGDGGQWYGNIYHGGTVGTYTVFANNTTLNGTAALTVSAGPAQTFVGVTPCQYYVTSGESATYTAMGLDACNNTVDITGSTTFTIQAGAGGAWNGNEYTSDNVGNWNVTATWGTNTQTCCLVVSPDAHCFIATAVYGEDGDATNILRDFRDEYMLTNPLGQALVELYYTVSPPIAQFLTEHPSLQPIVRAMLLPAVAMSAMVVNNGVATPTIMLVLLLVSIAVTVWATRRQRGPVHA